MGRDVTGTNTQITEITEPGDRAAQNMGDRLMSERLKAAGLRPTRQRLHLGELLFSKGDRHVTAELLHEEAVYSGERVSLATVYNTLHQFCAAGLLRELAIEGSKAYFDTNT